MAMDGGCFAVLHTDILFCILERMDVVDLHAAISVCYDWWLASRQVLEARGVLLQAEQLSVPKGMQSSPICVTGSCNGHMHIAEKLDANNSRTYLSFAGDLHPGVIAQPTPSLNITAMLAGDSGLYMVDEEAGKLHFYGEDVWIQTGQPLSDQPWRPRRLARLDLSPDCSVILSLDLVNQICYAHATCNDNLPLDFISAFNGPAQAFPLSLRLSARLKSVSHTRTAGFNEPIDLAVRGRNIFILERGGHCVRSIHVDVPGTVLRIGGPGRGGLRHPVAMAVTQSALCVLDERRVVAYSFDGKCLQAMWLSPAPSDWLSFCFAEGRLVACRTDEVHPLVSFELRRGSQMHAVGEVGTR
mmetsp:Transcript_8366/g.18233  ORF Transcript_8366/g.18233 Transcript_8366/m.18233 type:complete len:357 (-) Transcript_8366:618-1688(-)|eukprot:6207412-Pleurochrysis_carterae.AAC.10